MAESKSAKTISLPTALSPARRSGEDAQKLMAHTYYGLRYGIGIAAFFLPLGTRVGQQHLTGHSLPQSISGYYHTGMRNYFVATLVLIAGFLMMYQGFNQLENWLLNLAGLATVGMAFFPTGCDSGATQCATYSAPAVHGICAIIAFGSIGVVAVFLGSSNLDLLKDPKQVKRYRITYTALGAAMIILPLVTAGLAALDVASLYWIELVAMWVFVAYWAVKTIEFRSTHAETRAIEGTLPGPQHA
ncbi:MAG TPA: hypothetical protein VF557_11045 [Jatrophihabitans sp.]|uniref:hypothetical protein n=1 Tax=Jatrophihabitans sp. TaxID=1932789 RepID=UPI002F204B98